MHAWCSQTSPTLFRRILINANSLFLLLGFLLSSPAPPIAFIALQPLLPLQGFLKSNHLLLGWHSFTKKFCLTTTGLSFLIIKLDQIFPQLVKSVWVARGVGGGGAALRLLQVKRSRLRFFQTWRQRSRNKTEWRTDQV